MGGKIEPLVPQDPENAWMYVCGPTVYSYAHIFNARPAIVFDVLARMLRDRFPKLTYASNLIDVDDMNTSAALASLHALARQVHAKTDPGREAELVAALKHSADVLGLLGQEATTWGQLDAGDTTRIEALVAKRADAYAARDWSRANTLRAELVELGVEVEDAGGESRWRVRT